MILRWLWLFTIYTLNISLHTLLSYFAVDRAKDKVLCGINFGSIWTFGGGLVIAALPLYLASNYLFYYSYWYGYYGYHKIFRDKMWFVILTNWTANLFFWLTCW